MTTKTYLGGDNNYLDPSAWSPAGAPVAGDSVEISSGIVTINDSNISQETIQVFAGDVDLDNATLGTGTVFSAISTAAAQLNVAGTTKNLGRIGVAGGSLDINVGALGTPAIFTNAGTVDSAGGEGGSDLTISPATGSEVKNTGTFEALGNGVYGGGDLTLTGAGAFVNSGTMLADDGTITVAGQLTNTGLIETETSTVPPTSSEFPGTVNIAFGQESGIVFTNSGTLQNGSGSVFDISAAPGNGAHIENTGQIKNAGSMSIDVAVQQSGKGSIDLTGGNLLLEAGVTGGTVSINNASLEFGATPSMGFIGPASATDFTASVDFIGSSGTLQFDGVANLSEVLKGNELKVYADPTACAAPTQFASIRLIGCYSPSAFSVSGDVIQYVRPPS